MFRKSTDHSKGLQILSKVDILLILWIHYTRVHALTGNFKESKKVENTV